MAKVKDSVTLTNKVEVIENEFKHFHNSQIESPLWELDLP
jgi:hypothetical protein